MPVHCTIRENRTEKRVWTAYKVGQVACAAIRTGVTRAAIDLEISKCATGERGRPNDDELAQAVAVAEEALLANNAFLDADALSLQRFLVLPVLSAIVLRLIARIPVVGSVLAVALPALRLAATDQLKRVTVQRAANDAALLIVRRAAANAARFRQTGT